MRPKLVFRTPEFSPAPSRRCASERNIYVLSVRLNLFADLLRQLHHGANVRLPFPAQLPLAVVKSTNGDILASLLRGAYHSRALVVAART